MENKSYVGKKIQISNSQIGIDLSQKINPVLNTNYENIFSSCTEMIDTLARSTNSNVEKSNFLLSIYQLGKVAGGESTLKYVNERIIPTKNKVSERDIMLKNLHSIFPDLEKAFTEQEFMDFLQLYEKNPTSNEVKIVKTVYDLNLLLHYYKSTNKYKNKEIIDFIYDKINGIITNFDSNKIIELDAKTQNDINNLKLIQYNFNSEQTEYLNDIIQKYNHDMIKNYQLIEDLNDFRIEPEKKTKVR